MINKKKITEEKLNEFEKKTKDKFTKLLIKSLRGRLGAGKEIGFNEIVDFERILTLIERERNREMLGPALVGLKGDKTLTLKISKGRDSYSYNVPGRMLLSKLSNLIQREFDLEPEHLYEFEIGKFKFGPECDEWEEIFDCLDNFRLDAAICSADLKKGDSFKFIYDFGDNIKFKIKIADIMKDSKK